MPKMSVYLPDDLYAVVKRDGIPVSDLLQEAVRAQLAVDARLAAIDGYLAELNAEFGSPSEEAVRAADELTRQILAHGALPVSPVADPADAPAPKADKPRRRTAATPSSRRKAS